MMSLAVVRFRKLVIGLLIALLVLGLVVLLLWAVVVVPPRLIDTSQIPDPAKRLDEVNGLRTNLLGVLAGLAVVAGAVVGALNFRETSRQNRAVLELQRRGQVTERFTRAIEQLGQRADDKLDVRIGAVYALEQIARDSAELHWPIMEVLTAYLREHVAPSAAEPHATPALPTRLPADHQAIATVIGRRRPEEYHDDQYLDLHDTRLSGVLWRGAHLEWADLRGAHLEEADLVQAHLKLARLEGAHLEVAGFMEADLTAADLRGAHLEGAQLLVTNLWLAHLEGACLEGAQLIGANLEAANLRGANLKGADLRGAKGLTVEQLEAAIDPGSALMPDELASQLVRPEPTGDGRAGEGGSEAGPAQE